ncbi:uncharacterized protein [Musca autumnalis]|uniref:uncharacterized protein n=1 Tax=Musca autumnalis TaxID=221902 RepID=UPI003CE78644
MKFVINKVVLMLLFTFLIMLMLTTPTTCSAGVYFTQTLNDVPVHTVKVIHQLPSSAASPNFNTALKTFRVFEHSNDNHQNYAYSPHASSSSSTTSTYKVIHQQPSSSPVVQMQLLHQQSEERQLPATINVIREHKAERIKTLQTIRIGDGVTDAGYPSFGDAFETFKSLQAFGAFNGHISLVDSYGKPIAKSWQKS